MDKKLKEISWKDIKIGDCLPDRSRVIQKHSIHTCNTFKVTINFSSNLKEYVLSEDHLILVDISGVKTRYRNEILEQSKEYKIPIEEDIHVYSDSRFITSEEDQKIREILTNGGSESDLADDIFISNEVIRSEPKIYNKDKNLVWLTIYEISSIIRKDMIKNFCHLKSNDNKIIDVEYNGEKECFCISTDTGRYSTDNDNNKNDLIHHNSVAIRNIVLHCLTHGIPVGLIDLKLVEFSPYKGHKGVIGVANTVSEAAELLRVAREIMYKRNAELEKAGVVQMSDYKPKKPTNIVEIFGREFNDDEIITIRDYGTHENERQVTAKELLEILNSKEEKKED